MASPRRHGAQRTGESAASTRKGEAGRWASAAELLRLVRIEPRLSRRDAGRRLGLSTGTMSDLMERMRRSRLLDEVPGAAEGRGRPSPLLTAHAEGPLVAVVHLRGHSWRIGIGDVEGVSRPAGRGDVAGRGPEEELPRIARALGAVRAEHEGRVKAVSVVAAGVVEGDRLAWLAHSGWRDADLSLLVGGTSQGAPPLLLAENDATLAGLAEARLGAARAVRCSLHLMLAEGVGGALLVDGEAIRGARSSGGEFGHMPFGDRSRRCDCGARGCWNVDLDGRTFARWAGEPEPAQGAEHLEEVLVAAAAGAPVGPGRRAAIDRLAAVFGAGAAGIVNAHDPELVSLGGLAPLLHQLAPDALEDAYRDGLMRYRRDAPPPLVDARFGIEGAAIGALHHGLDAITTPEVLAQP
ncbi:ROK family protein [Brachybacterium hainanense]|uniref:ROK family protein n=1 Tax=Brachybacterium hainanense TaxID=1541174 RepID=A0ABV6RJM1_9MICO